jgi:TonB-linked SusC/RagA family outer membrane protein
MVFSLGYAVAQERTVTGVVSAQDEGPLPGVNVTVQGTTTGVISGADGSFTIKVPGTTSTLVFSSVGYTTQEILVGDKSRIDVVLVADVKALQEVVVTGYTVQRRRDLTGSVGVVTPAELTSVPVGNVTNALQGQTSGLIVTSNGQPNADSKVRIRGFASFEQNDPLYVIDGVPTQNQATINSLNPNDIEFLSVLKDAGAASIYGSRASNGVIIINTKRGNKGLNISYNMYAGVQDPGKGPDNLLNTQEYAQLQWMVYENDHTSPTTVDPTTGEVKQVIHPIYGWIGNPQPTMPDWAANTNWYSAITHTAWMQNHDLSLSGGGDNSRFFAGFGIRRQDGVIIYTNENKYTGRFNSEFTFINGRVKIGENFSPTYRTNLGVDNLEEASPISMAVYRTQPIIPVKWTGAPFNGTTHDFVAGDWGGTGIAGGLGNSENSVANLTRNRNDKYWDIRLLGSSYVDVKIIQGLNFRSTLGGTWNNGYGVDYTYATYERAENVLSPNLDENTYYESDWVFTNTVTFDKTFGIHKLLAVGGYEASKYNIHREMNATRGGYFTDDPLYRTLTNGATINAANSSFDTPTTLISQFMRADYQLMDRYMLSATIRRDGSSKFGQDNRYGIFPSFSLGWRISDEPFFDGVNFINELKLRGSYGSMGNQLALAADNLYYSYGGDPQRSFYSINGNYSGSIQGFYPTRIGNQNAKWETNITADIGFEATFLNSKLGLKFDWYSKKTKDLLYNPELPATAGPAATAPYINIAAMSNKGVDMELSYTNKWGEFGFNGAAMLTTYKNNIDAVAEGVQYFDQTGGVTRISGNSNNRNAVGHPISSFFGYKVIGLFQSDAEVSEAPAQTGAAPGLFKFQDTNGDNKITPEDRVFIGDPNPNFTYSFNLGFNFRSFDVSAFLYGSQGADIFNSNRYFIDFWPSFQGQKSKELLYNSWRPDRTNTNIPKATTAANFSTNEQVNSYYLENGSYLRLRTLELGYTLPTSLTSKINVGHLRLYLQAANLFTVSKYSGLDPELGGDDRAFGSDTGNYPLVRNYLFGVNLNF